MRSNKHAIFFFALCILWAVGFSQTNIFGGDISGHWTKAGSPYLVNGSLNIPDTATLTIDAGVTVEFQNSFYIQVTGRLLVLGELGDSVTFCAKNAGTGWAGIRFMNVPVASDSSLVLYGIIRDVKNGTGGDLNAPSGSFYFYKVSKIRIQSCRISNNAGAYGGGVYCRESTPAISYCKITQNTTTGAGGGAGIFLEKSNATITNNFIAFNFANNNGSDYAHGGGGITIDHSGNPVISNNIICNNTSNSFGGGICVSGFNLSIYPNAQIRNNIIVNNVANGNGSAMQGGGGMFFWCTSGGTVSNNVICNNTSNANTGGGALFLQLSGPFFINNTIANNLATKKGGAVYCMNASGPSFGNTLLWGNSSSLGGNVLWLEDESSDPNFFYCDVQGAQSSIGLNGVNYNGAYSDNINLNPLFVNPTPGTGAGFDAMSASWKLSSTSPCINAGDPAGFYPTLDCGGNPRVIGGFIDIGAYEYSTPGGVSSPGDEAMVSLYPNPGRGNTQLHIKGLTPERVALRLRDIAGKEVFTTHMNTSGSKAQIELPVLNAGVYWLEIEGEGFYRSIPYIISNKDQ